MRSKDYLQCKCSKYRYFLLDDRDFSKSDLADTGSDEEYCHDETTSPIELIYKYINSKKVKTSVPMSVLQMSQYRLQGVLLCAKRLKSELNKRLIDSPMSSSHLLSTVLNYVHIEETALINKLSTVSKNIKMFMEL
jgi:hypothetical protein